MTINNDIKNLRLSILVPVYNSENTIGRLIDRVVEVLSPLVHLHEIVLVNDGSADNSHGVIMEAIERHPNTIRYVRLFRNFGEHNAVMAGLNHVTGDAVAIIDDDFQNPPEEIIHLCKKLIEGYDVVYSYYEEKKHNAFRNLGSKFNDIVATMLLNKPRNLYLSSFKVIAAPLVKIIIQYDGPFPYIDGLILRSTTNIGRALVAHSAREEGKSNYTLTKLIRLWLNMFTGFSILPLRFSSYLGFFLFLFSILLTIFFITIRFTGSIFIRNQIPPGWASLIVLTTFFFGIQFMMMGMIGEYLGRLFMANQSAPQFLIRDVYGIESEEIKEHKEHA